jgi:hypothetical protein
MELISMLNLFIWENFENLINPEFDYARHPKPNFSNCFFTWFCGNANYMTMKNAHGTFFGDWRW